MSRTITDTKYDILSWSILLGASIVGLLSSFIQTIERVNYAKPAGSELFCDINSVFSCSNVFDAWQSSVFGFPNSIMCLTFFSIIAGIAIVGLTGSKIHKAIRFSTQFASVFFLGFGAWYLWQSTFVINYICMFCLFCYAAVIAMNLALLRINAPDIFRSKNSLETWNNVKKSGYDTLAWILWAVIVALVIITKFW